MLCNQSLCEEQHRPLRAAAADAREEDCETISGAVILKIFFCPVPQKVRRGEPERDERQGENIER